MPGMHLESVEKSENPHLQILPGLTNGVHSDAVDDSPHRPVRLGAKATSSKAARRSSRGPPHGILRDVSAP